MAVGGARAKSTLGEVAESRICDSGDGYKGSPHEGPAHRSSAVKSRGPFPVLASHGTGLN